MGSNPIVSAIFLLTFVLSAPIQMWERWPVIGRNKYQIFVVKGLKRVAVIFYGRIDLF